MIIEYRRVGPGDEDLFLRVAEEVFDEPVPIDRLKAYLADPTQRLVVARADGEMIGQAAAVLHRHPDKTTQLYIDEVGVTPRYRNQGVAKRLIDELAAWGRELGCKDAWLGAEIDNPAANALYEKYAKPEPFLMYQWDL